MSEIPVGPELDREVAELVMELQIIHASKSRPAICHGSKVCWGAWIDTGESHEWGPVVKDVPPYSTEIGATWLVVEKMTGKGLRMELDFEKWPPEKDWDCTFSGQVGDDYLFGRASADTAPEAICRAALAAIGDVT